MTRNKRFLAMLICIVILVTSFSGCSTNRSKNVDKEKVEPTNVEKEPTIAPTFTATPTVIPTPNPEAGIVIDREKHEETNSKVKDSWTIFLYMCGTDLESGNGFASSNLQELFDVTYNDNVKIIVETGGTKEWKADGIKNDRLERFIIEDGGMTKVGEAKLASMGDENTLYEFLSWGVNAYPADRMGVILWDHGSGSIDGVVFDELFDYDSLSLLEMDSAFRKAYGEMTSDFEFIGFDACLMSTIETANIMASYADYMIASQEYEGGPGWDYEALASYLVERPTANGAELGKVICDSFAAKSGEDIEDTYYTLSVVDLEKIDKLLYAFDTVARKMSESTSQEAIISELARGAFSADRFGANSEYEGYSNMIDLGLYISNVSKTVGGAAAEAITFALDDAVVYKVNGIDHKDATGLSVYYPLQPDYEGLSTMSGICVSPYYLVYMDAITYGSTGNSLKDYSSDYWDDNYGGYYSDYATESDDWYTNWDDHWEDYYNTDELSEDSEFDFGEEDSQNVISYEVEPYLNEEGNYTLTIAKDSIDYVQGVYCSIFLDRGDDELLYLGMDNDLYFDWDTGVVEDTFKGYWPTLPDNQHLEMILINSTTEYNMYSIPILLNGTQTNLRIKWVWKDPLDDSNNYGDYVVIGTWDGIDSETGMSAKEVVPLTPGDVITPIYVSYKSETDTTETLYGQDYTVTDNFFIEGNLLDAGDYYYSFEILDIFGQSTYTDFTVYKLDEEGNIFYD